jgi:hypothetical protein
MLPSGNVNVTWKAVRGMYHKIQYTTDLINWTDVAPYSLSYSNGSLVGDSSGTWTDVAPAGTQRYYRVVRTANP